MMCVGRVVQVQHPAALLRCHVAYCLLTVVRDELFNFVVLCPTAY